MKKATKTTIQGYVMNAVILLLLWSGIPFFTSIAGVGVWMIAIFVTLVIPLVFLGLYISDGDKLEGEAITKILDMQETLTEKMWVKKFIGWGVVLFVSYSLYEHEWTAIAYYWVILTVILNAVVIPLLRARVNDMLKDYETAQVNKFLKEAP